MKEKFWLLSVLLLLGLLTSCKTKYISVPEYHNIYVEKHDTLIQRDSIYTKDSIFMWKQGDTIWKEKFSIIYKDRWRDKIVYRDSIRTDSIRVPYPVERSLNPWEKACIKTGKLLIPIVVILIIFAVARRFLR